MENKLPKSAFGVGDILKQLGKEIKQEPADLTLDRGSSHEKRKSSHTVLAPRRLTNRGTLDFLAIFLFLDLLTHPPIDFADLVSRPPPPLPTPTWKYGFQQPLPEPTLVFPRLSVGNEQISFA